jgi:hypothetical protein
MISQLAAFMNVIGLVDAMQYELVLLVAFVLILNIRRALWRSRTDD